MDHEHDIFDTDSDFIIDPITRTITTSSQKLYLVQFDHKSELYTFKIPRFIEGHDMGESDEIIISYDNSTRKKDQSNTGECLAETVTVEEDVVRFTWLVTNNSTQIAGYLSFYVTFRCHDEDSNVIYELGTDSFKQIIVIEKKRYTQSIIENNPDLIAQIRKDLLESAVTSVNNVEPDENGNVEIEIPEGFSGSWNDLTDKPFGEETGLIALMGKTTFADDSFNDFYVDGTKYNTESGIEATLVEGDTYVVEYNGVEYTCVAVKVTWPTSAICLGNTYLAGPEFNVDTGEPFCVLNKNGTLQFYFTTSDSYTISVYALSETIKTLDEAYIPSTIARTSDIPTEEELTELIAALEAEVEA